MNLVWTDLESNVVIVAIELRKRMTDSIRPFFDITSSDQILTSTSERIDGQKGSCYAALFCLMLK